MNNKRSKLQVFFFPNQHEIRCLRKRIEEFSQLNDAELITAYNDKAATGMFGVHAQTREVVSLGLALKQRFGDPIVHLKKNLIYCPCTVELRDDGSLKKTEFTEW